MPKPILRTDVLEMKDLKEGMVLKGTVRNVIDFGAGSADIRYMDATAYSSTANIELVNAIQKMTTRYAQTVSFSVLTQKPMY